MSARVSSGAESKQDFGTPPALIRAVEKRFGPVAFDLAAHAGNAKHARFFTEEDNALASTWSDIPGVACGSLLWLNPPFRDIDPWAEKCRREASLGARVAFLTPASVGSQWFYDRVWKLDEGREFVDVYFLLGRLTFEGSRDPYPKDCMLTVFSRKEAGAAGEVDVWDWRKDAA